MRRRDFLAALPALATLPVPPELPRPSRYRVGLIGCGWYGKNDLFRLTQVADVEVVGLCDVDQRMLADTAARLPAYLPGAGPRLYADYRHLLRREKPDLVLIATPDHWHALPAVAALKAGAHVYLQKPTARDVRESEAILDAARRHKRVVQVAFQRRSTPHLVAAKRRFVDSGRLGAVHQARLCCYYHMRDAAVREAQPVPGHFDYDAWTGPAPLLPFKGLPHRRWRAFRAYGNGIVGDMATHMLDTVRWLLDLGMPEAISSAGGIYAQTDADATITDTQTATFHFPKLEAVWQHRTYGPPADPDYPWGFALYGSKGTLKGSVHRAEFLPLNGEIERLEAVYERESYPLDLVEPDIELHAAPATRAHLRDWLAAIDEGRPPVADIETGHLSSIACLLANIARDHGRTLRYDSNERTFRQHTDLNAALRRPYRAAYRHPGKRG